MTGDVGSSKERIAELHAQMEDVSNELGDARVDKHEENRRKKKQEIVENFKRLYPGVYDRQGCQINNIKLYFLEYCYFLTWIPESSNF